MQAVLAIETLPEAALDAAEAFNAKWLPAIREQLGRGEDIVIVLPSAPFDHTDWRRGAVRDLARAYAPARVNFITTSTAEAVGASVEYLSGAAGVTGQYLPLHENAHANG